MQRIESRWFVITGLLAVALAACGQGRRPAADCTTVAGKLAGTVAGETSPVDPDQWTAWTTEVTGVMTTSCQQDQWPASYTACVAAAADAAAVEACGQPYAVVEAKVMARLQPALEARAAADREAARGQCDVVVSKVSGVMGQQMAASLPADKASKWTARLREVMAASCREDGWPAPLMRCVLAAADDKAVDACGDGMKADKGMEEKMMKRIQPLMDEMMKDMMSGMEQGGAGASAPTTP